jgi:hypothetical protein
MQTSGAESSGRHGLRPQPAARALPLGCGRQSFSSGETRPLPSQQLHHVWQPDAMPSGDIQHVHQLPVPHGGTGSVSLPLHGGTKFIQATHEGDEIPNGAQAWHLGHARKSGCLVDQHTTGHIQVCRNSGLLMPRIRVAKAAVLGAQGGCLHMKVH